MSQTTNNHRGVLFYVLVVPAGFIYAGCTGLMRATHQGALACGRGVKELGYDTVSGAKEIKKIALNTLAVSSELGSQGFEFTSDAAGQLFSFGASGAGEIAKSAIISAKAGIVISEVPLRSTVNVGKEVLDATVSAPMQVFRAASTCVKVGDTLLDQASIIAEGIDREALDAAVSGSKQLYTGTRESLAVAKTSFGASFRFTGNLFWEVLDASVSGPVQVFKGASESLQVGKFALELPLKLGGDLTMEALTMGASGSLELYKGARQSSRIGKVVVNQSVEVSQHLGKETIDVTVAGSLQLFKGSCKSVEVGKVILESPFIVVKKLGKEVADVTISASKQLWKGGAAKPFFVMKDSGAFALEASKEMAYEIATTLPPCYFESRKLALVTGSIIYDIASRGTLQKTLAEAGDSTVSAGRELKKLTLRSVVVSQVLASRIQTSSLDLILQIGDQAASGVKESGKGIFAAGRATRVIAESTFENTAAIFKEFYETLIVGALVNVIASGRISVSVLRTGWDSVDASVYSLANEVGDYVQSSLKQGVINVLREIYTVTTFHFVSPRDMILEFLEQNWDHIRSLVGEIVKGSKLIANEGKGFTDVVVDGKILFYQQKVLFLEWLHAWRQQHQ